MFPRPVPNCSSTDWHARAPRGRSFSTLWTRPSSRTRSRGTCSVRSPRSIPSGCSSGRDERRWRDSGATSSPPWDRPSSRSIWTIRNTSNLPTLQSMSSLRLLAEDDPARTSPYRNRPELASQVAHAVGEKAYPVFLIARLISQSLLEADKPVDVTRPDWEAFPTTVDAAFDEYLDRFGANKERVVDLFRPLAYAEGAGLPFENLWAPMASALSAKTYRAGDVEWLMEHAGAFLVEATEDDRSVYRLYHHALIYHVRFPRRPLSEVQREFTETLIRQTPDRRDGGGKDWLQASPYVRQHLASHAAAAGMLGAGMLGELTNDLLYLATAEPRRLLHAMDKNTSGDQLNVEIAHVYQVASHNLLSLDTITARNSRSMVGEPSPHFLVGPGPLERMGVATVILRPRQHHMIDQSLAALPRPALQVSEAEHVVEQLRLVQPGGAGRRQSGSPPTVAGGEIILRDLARMAGTAVMDQIDPPKPAVVPSELLQGRDIVIGIIGLQTKRLHLPAMDDQEIQDVDRAMPDIVELLMLDRAGDARRIGIRSRTW